jgi:quercetin dioxygenase-like cupin family protein
VHYEVMTSDLEAKLRAEATQCYEWSNGPGAVYADHEHPYRKILYVVAGSITFTPEGKLPIVMRPGERLELPPRTRHGAVVGDKGVVCLEGRARIT